MSVANFPVPLIATGGAYNNVIVLRDGKPPQVLEGHRSYVGGVSFCPTDPDLLASASNDKTIVLWDLKSNSKIKILRCTSSLYSVSWSCDGQYLAAACYDRKCYVFDTHNGYKQLCVLEGHTDFVWAVAFHPHNSAVCATASYDGTVRVWQLCSGSQQPQSPEVLEHGRIVDSCCWMPDRKHLVSGGDDGVVRLWSVEDGTELARFEDHSSTVFSVAASPDGRMIASASWDNTCRIREANSGGKQLQVLEHPDYVRAVTFTSDGLHVVTGCADGNTRVWGIAVGKVVAALGGHASAVWSVAVPPAQSQAAATVASTASGQQERRYRSDE